MVKEDTLHGRVAALEEEIAQLRAEVAYLRSRLHAPATTPHPLPSLPVTFSPTQRKQVPWWYPDSTPRPEDAVRG